MTVKNRKEAWEQANKLFPTDYEKDERASANAGYPIYVSTAEGVNAWISDLNVTLELNVPDKKEFKSIRINIQTDPEIKEERTWSMDQVRLVCIHENWYTEGTVKQYSEMLGFVENNKPTGLNLFKVASDILEHTDEKQGQTIENIMFILGKDACNTFFTVD